MRNFFGLVNMLGRENVGMITGDSQINPQAPVICCTAEILANQALREGEWSDVGCVAMDEFHFYSDPTAAGLGKFRCLRFRMRSFFL